jgi:hypothetical protein
MKYGISRHITRRMVVTSKSFSLFIAVSALIIIRFGDCEGLRAYRTSFIMVLPIPMGLNQRDGAF